MIKSSMPNIPGMAAMTETFDFVKNLWGGMGNSGMAIPGMVMPTLSAEEVDKQIKDLKAVESWLSVNMNMLRGTIQALEVQSATITTLRTMGENFSAAVAPEKAIKKPAPFYSAPAPEPEDEDEDDDEEEVAREEAAAARRKSRDALKAEFKSEPAKPAQAPKGAADPAQWWNQLQEQFKQAVSTAMAPEAMAAAAKSAMPTMAPAPARKKAAAPVKPAAKPLRKAAAKPAAKKAKR